MKLTPEADAFFRTNYGVLRRAILFHTENCTILRNHSKIWGRRKGVKTRADTPDSFSTGRSSKVVLILRARPVPFRTVRSTEYGCSKIKERLLLWFSLSIVVGSWADRWARASWVYSLGPRLEPWSIGPRSLRSPRSAWRPERGRVWATALCESRGRAV